MANTYPNIAIRPVMTGYPLVNQQTSDAQAAADFQRILNAPGNKVQANSASTASTGTSFKDFMKGLFDVINPLQHIPVVSAIYRHLTGDQISPAAHFIGDALYGGPVGGAIAAADIAFQKSTGKDMGETVIASLTGGGKTPASPAPETMTAQNLNNITPAAGDKKSAASDSRKTSAADNIIWSDNDNNSIIWASRAPLFPPLPQGTTGEGPASPSTPAQPVLSTKGIASTTAFQSHEAPASTDRKAVPPELIASRMMDGLQKYAAMKAAGLGTAMATPAFSAQH